MTSRYGVWLAVLLVLGAGCGTTPQPTDEPTRNATLSLPGYDRTAAASPVETRVFWDRSKNWEDPGNRTVTVTSRTHAYRNPSQSGAEAVVVYTTPKKPYVGEDRVRSLPAPALADLATRSVETPPLGNRTGPTFDATLFDEEVRVWALTDAAGATTGYVARVTHGGAIVVVVVAGDADGPTVERVLGGVVLSGRVADVEAGPLVARNVMVVTAKHARRLTN